MTNPELPQNKPIETLSATEKKEEPFWVLTDQINRRLKYGPSENSESLLNVWNEVKQVLNGNAIDDIYNGEMFVGQTLLNNMTVKINKLVANPKYSPNRPLNKLGYYYN